jgi:hypothetical protein
LPPLASCDAAVHSAAGFAEALASSEGRERLC